MDSNAPLIIFGVLALLALIIFIVAKNKKDRKELEEKLNQDFKGNKRHDDEVNTEGNESI